MQLRRDHLRRSRCAPGYDTRPRRKALAPAREKHAANSHAARGRPMRGLGAEAHQILIPWLDRQAGSI